MQRWTVPPNMVPMQVSKNNPAGSHRAVDRPAKIFEDICSSIAVLGPSTFERNRFVWFYCLAHPTSLISSLLSLIQFTEGHST